MSALTATPNGLGSTTAAESEAALGRKARKARRRRLLMLWAGRAALAVFIIGGWQLFTDLGWVDSFFFGKPSMIWQALRQLFEQGSAFGSIWVDIETTLKEAVYGFVLGSITGVLLGLLLGQNPLLSDILSPYIKVVNAIPRIILGSIFLVAFGLGTFPKVLLAGVLVFFIVFFNAFQGVREVDQNLVNNVRVLGASPLQVARHVTVPSAFSWIIASLHTAFGFAIIGALVAEVLGSQRGLGLIIAQAQGHLDVNTVFAGMAITTVITLVAEYLITLLERRVLSWRPPSQSEQANPVI